MSSQYKCFRYKLSEITILICVIVSMVSAYYGITIFKNIVIEHNEKAQFEYYSKTAFTVISNNILNDIQSLGNLSCNLKMKDYMLYSDSENATILVDIIMKTEEENIPLISGRYISQKELESGEKVVILGRTNEKYAFSKNGASYYTIMGEDYRVIGVAGTSKSVIYDSLVMLYVSGLGDNIKSTFDAYDEFGYSMILQSNDTDSLEVYKNNIQNQLQSTLNVEESQINNSAEPLYNEKFFCVLIYIFCFVGQAISFQYYIMQRTREMHICKAYGFTNFKIICRIYKSVFLILFIGISLAGGLIGGINMTLGDYAVEYNLAISSGIIVPYFLAMFFSCIIIGVKPIYQLFNCSIVQTLNDKE